MGIGYSFAKQLKTSGIFGAAVSLMSWFILMPYSITGSISAMFDANGAAMEVVEGAKATVTGVDLGWLGAKGIFMGIICGLVSVHVYAG